MKDVLEYIKQEEFKMIISTNYINIVYYDELITLEDERICISHKNGRIVIKGQNLSIGKMLEKEILILGEFKTIELG